mmetsp:Transcript_14551/g.58104  ORF Transcript_14551/g.58104 Transcript_14551/m.58104 type:complete len:117 (+) Transcript_14551:259-609(+)
MPAPNRVCCLLSGPLAAVGRAVPDRRSARPTSFQAGVEGELRSLPLLDTDAERSNLESALREGCRETGRAIELEIRYATLDALKAHALDLDAARADEDRLNDLRAEAMRRAGLGAP